MSAEALSETIAASVVEINRGSRIKPNWRVLQSFDHFYDAERWMFRNPQDKATRARRLDGKLTSYAPFGPLDKGE